MDLAPIVDFTTKSCFKVPCLEILILSRGRPETPSIHLPQSCAFPDDYPPRNPKVARALLGKALSFASLLAFTSLTGGHYLLPKNKGMDFDRIQKMPSWLLSAELASGICLCFVYCVLPRIERSREHDFIKCYLNTSCLLEYVRYCDTGDIH